MILFFIVFYQANLLTPRKNDIRNTKEKKVNDSISKLNILENIFIHYLMKNFGKKGKGNLCFFPVEKWHQSIFKGGSRDLQRFMSLFYKGTWQ